MLRLQGHIIGDKKVIWIWLTAVYGIGRNKSKEILDRLSIPLEKKVKDLTDKEVKSITDELREMVLENDLRREVSWEIKRLKEIKCYRWMRHNLWLPVRWQKTKVNARTAKKLLGRSRVRPVLKK